MEDKIRKYLIDNYADEQTGNIVIYRNERAKAFKELSRSLSIPVELPVGKKFTDISIFTTITGHTVYLNGYRICGDKPDNNSKLIYNHDKILMKDIKKAFSE